MQKLDGKSKDITAENIENLKQLFPEAFTEDGSADDADGRRLGKKIDFEVLKELLGEYVSDKDERYSFRVSLKSLMRSPNEWELQYISMIADVFAQFFAQF